ncbi:MAG: glycosyltransferase family 2 protein, partial [Bacillaceae bacterium]|nr:glycosyltransferase family 2 protein [Bacillaceae bacterium]
MSNAYPSVGIIVINYNGYDDTVECIESLIKLRYPNKKIYIVDNCSPDLSGKRLK